MLGGKVLSIEEVDVSLGGGFIIYPDARIGSDTASEIILNRVQLACLMYILL